MASFSSSSSSSSKRLSLMSNPKSVADRVSWYCAIGMLVLILFGSIKADSSTEEPAGGAVMRGSLVVLDRPCDEIYVVSEGETLHTISDKCGDPFIVERNPHIHDPDDVFPGLVIKIIPSRLRN